MTKDIKKSGLTVFEQIRRTDENGNEFWSAREMAKVLEYSEYRHFLPVIERAKEACKNSGYKTENHFEDILEMVPIGALQKDLGKKWFAFSKMDSGVGNMLNLLKIKSNE